MKAFRVQDKVKLSEELLRYSANKHWLGKTGEVLKILGENMCLVKYEHLDKPIEQYTDFIDHV